MEKLIFTNANGQEIEFSNTSSYKWTQVDDLGASSVELQRTTSPFQDGSTNVSGAYFNSRTIKIDLVVVDYTDLNATFRNLNNILNPKLGLGFLSYYRDNDVKVLNKVRTRVLPSMLGGDSRDFGTQKTSIIFEVFDPLYSDLQNTEEIIAANELLFRFPIDITDAYEFDLLYADGKPIYNIGDTDCPITLIVDGAITQPLKIENTTTGEKIVIGLDLLDNERLIITTEVDNINVIKTNLITGIKTIAFEYIDIAQTSFFYLVTGENKIKVTANEGDVETAMIRFKNRYVGV